MTNGRGPMTRVRVPERVMAELHRASADEVTGGLVIGYPTNAGFWVERVLRCRNAANSGFFSIDPNVLSNVRATLAETPFSVLGFFISGPDAGTRTDCGDLWIPPETLWLRPSRGGARAWWKLHGRETTELEIELVPTLARSPVACPD